MMDSAEIDTIFDDDEAKSYSFYRLYYSVSRSRSELAVTTAELRRLKAQLARQSRDLARMEASVRVALLAIPEAKQQVRNQFSYRLGNAITRVRSIVGLVRLPSTLLKERKVYLARRASHDNALPPATDFSGGRSYLADKTPRYVKVAAGRDDVIRVTGRVVFSGGDPHQSVHLRVSNLDAATGAGEIVPILIQDGDFNITFSGRDSGAAVTFFASGEFPAMINVRSVKISSPG
ncbi:MAG TPA: hypothetical protein DCG71_05645 [Brevundimonas sp.]|nr:hypothetical protein [Brevundimonas sp.]